MENQLQFAQSLLDFIGRAPTAFHAAAAVKDELLRDGFQELSESEAWQLTPHGRYFVMKNQSALVAFTLGGAAAHDVGFRLISAHTDSPGFRIKPSPDMLSEGRYVRLNTEVYGGPILSTWFDRPLSVAGRVALAGSNPLQPEIRLVDLAKPLLLIPNLAIHMNRDVNEGVALNRQKDTLPLLAEVQAGLEHNGLLLRLVAEELQIDEADILDFDLFLYEYEAGSLLGPQQEFISAGRLDDLSMVHAALHALVAAKQTDGVNVFVAFDNEEIGSRTKQGGDSEFLSHTLERIVLAQRGGREEFLRALSRSFLISADLAHAVHPNYGDKHDPSNRPLLNGGPVLKIAANQSYTSDGDSGAVFAELCRQANVPLQRFVNRSDQKGGSTIGPISASHLDIRSVDVGSPILAMHSVRELAGVADHSHIHKVFLEFYQL